MRVNPNPLPDLLAALNQNQQQLNTDQQQIASGQSVNLPSDNPAAAAGLVQNADQTSQADQFLRSMGSVQGEMQSADSTLSSVVTALQRAISLGVEGANGTLSDGDRAAIAQEVTRHSIAIGQSGKPFVSGQLRVRRNGNPNHSLCP